MLLHGAIIGDIVGSAYEFHNCKSRNFELFSSFSKFTDDTVMTIAVYRALKSVGIDAEELEVKKAVTKYMQELGRAYPNAGYGGNFEQWIWSDNPQPYNSWGNGSAMRVSSVVLFADTLQRVRELARWTAEVTHNHPEGVKGAEATASAVYLARTNWTKEEIQSYIEDTFGYKFRPIDQIRPTYIFHVDCMESVPEAIECFLEADSYEATLRNVMYLGGDTDTMGAIAGAIAGQYFGIPEEFIEKADQYLAAQGLIIG